MDFRHLQKKAARSFSSVIEVLQPLKPPSNRAIPYKEEKRSVHELFGPDGSEEQSENALGIKALCRRIRHRTNVPSDAVSLENLLIVIQFQFPVSILEGVDISDESFHLLAV